MLWTKLEWSAPRNTCAACRHVRIFFFLTEMGQQHWYNKKICPLNIDSPVGRQMEGDNLHKKYYCIYGNLFQVSSELDITLQASGPRVRSQRTEANGLELFPGSLGSRSIPAKCRKDHTELAISLPSILPGARIRECRHTPSNHICICMNIYINIYMYIYGLC